LLISVFADLPRLPEECEVFNRFDVGGDAVVDIEERVALEGEAFFCWSLSFLFEVDPFVLAILSSDISPGGCMGSFESVEGRELSKGGVVVDGWTGAAATISRTLGADRGARPTRSYSTLREHGSLYVSISTPRKQRSVSAVWQLELEKHGNDASVKSHF
jgi:hypothetical protein